MQNLINIINLIPALIGAMVGVVLTVIAAWHQIKKAYQDGGEDMLDIVGQAMPLIGAQEVLMKPNEDKNFEVSTELLKIAKKPVKKFKLDDVVAIGSVVSQIYGFVKPLFKKK